MSSAADLRGLLALALIEGMAEKARQEAARRPADTVRLDAPDRAPYVRLRPDHAHTGWCNHGSCDE